MKAAFNVLKILPRTAFVNPHGFAIKTEKPIHFLQVSFFRTLYICQDVLLVTGQDHKKHGTISIQHLFTISDF